MNSEILWYYTSSDKNQNKYGSFPSDIQNPEQYCHDGASTITISIVGCTQTFHNELKPKADHFLDNRS